MNTTPSIGVAVITHNAVRLLPRNLPPLLNSPLKPRVMVVNSSSGDGTIELAREMGAEVLVVPRNEFNHGLTRERARKALGTDIVVMVTPDAILLDSAMLENLVRPLISGEASVSYGRQIPHDGADFFEAFPRIFNYPDASELRSQTDIAKYGVGTFFCSDTFAAWRNSALDSIGGFSPTLASEDWIATAKLLKTGHRIAYRSDAVVKHSHSYTLLQEFKRYFDTGYVRAHNKALFLAETSDEKRGAAFTGAMLKALARTRPWLIPYAILGTGIKFVGYRIGLHGIGLPLWLKKRISGQDYFWVSAVSNN